MMIPNTKKKERSNHGWGIKAQSNSRKPPMNRLRDKKKRIRFQRSREASVKGVPPSCCP